jgi:membrane-associated phospholipid phosphatase
VPFTHLNRRATGERFFLRPQRALLLGGALLLLFVLVALLVPTQPLALEQRWADWMRELQSPVLERVALVFNDLGRGLGRALTLAAIGLLLIVARRWWALLAFAVTESLTPLAGSVVKAMVDRPRPPDGLVHPTGASFPSGHASYAGATSVALVLLFTLAGQPRRRWWALAVLGIAAMAWSRTYLQVHWLLDVLAGSILGAGIALLVFAGLQLLRGDDEGGARPQRVSRP